MQKHLDFSGEYMGPVPIQAFSLGHLVIPVPLHINAFMELNSVTFNASGKTVEELVAANDKDYLQLLHDVFQRIPAMASERDEDADSGRSVVPGMIIEDTEIDVAVYAPPEKIPVLTFSFMLEPPNLA